MCLAIPMKVLEVSGTQGVVELGGVRRAIDFSLVGAVEVGQYVVVHAGFALSVTDEEEAQKTLALFNEMVRRVEEADQRRARK